MQPILIPGRDTLPRASTGTPGDVVTLGSNGRAAYSPPLIREQFTLGGIDITNKYVTVGQNAADGTMELRILGAGDQISGTDYYQDGRKLRWNGKSLDGVLISGDTIIVSYRKVP